MKDNKVVRAAVIDIGTHSIRLLIAEEAESDIKVLESLKNVTLLGKDTFYKGRFSQETINRTVAILEKYAEKLKEYDISDVKVIATTAVREADNRDVFIDTISRRTGLNIEVFTAGDVIYYIDAYLYHILKDKYPLHTKNLLIAEIGAGSLDISVMAQGYTLMNIGLPLGMLRLKQLMSKLDGSRKENYAAVGENIECEFAYLKRDLASVKVDDIILIDESYTSFLPKLIPEKVFQHKFFQMNLAETQGLLETIANQDAEQIAAEHKIPSESADTFAGYAMILNTFANLTENKNIHILEASLAEAVLAYMVLDFEVSQKYNKTNQLISVSKWLCEKYNVDLRHVQHIAEMSETLFDGFKETLGLKKSDLLYLLLASYLHPIGMFIYNRAHHKHTEYIISNLNLFRLTDEEIKVIACIARYHRRGLPADSHLVYQSLAKDKQILVQKLSSILRISNALDRAHKLKVKKLQVEFTRGQDIVLQVRVEGNFVLEKLEFIDKKEMFEEISGKKINLKIQSI
ncbi:MAG: hypothetical protein HQL23_01405 [Candidatus Omnitrophica bacterium]|nr:hypothetical protein [Candidatus Omnitrophota bacterium]